MSAALIGWSALAAIVLCSGLHFTLKQRQHWLVACLITSGLYVVLSLQLERSSGIDHLAGLRWGLFAAALFSFVRYRFVGRVD